MIAFAVGIAALVGAGFVQAAPSPTEPSSTSVFNAGGTCTIRWDADATGAWKDMNIQLMTGDNWNMVHITTVAQNIDATDPTKNTFTYTCPEVTPNSAIYFYQFSSASDPKNLLWTTRWTLASASGATTPPSEDTQPDGQKIPWGRGALVDPSTAVPAPAYLAGAGQAGSSASGTSAGSTITVTAQSTVPAETSAPAATMTTARATSTGTRAGASSGSGTSSTSATAASSTNGAMGVVVPGVATVFGAVLAAVGLF